MSLVQGLLILMLRSVSPCWILVVSRSLPSSLGRERGIPLANHPTDFLSVMSVWTNLGHGGGERQGKPLWHRFGSCPSLKQLV